MPSRNAGRKWRSALRAVTTAQRLARLASDRSSSSSLSSSLAVNASASDNAKGHSRNASTDVSEGGYDTAEEDGVTEVCHGLDAAKLDSEKVEAV
jgi:hypothetical protein